MRTDRLRVMIGNLDPITTVGMARTLADEGIEVVGHSGGAELVAQVGRLRPDVVLLDLETAASQALGARVREVSARTKVILWARGEDLMEVLDPGTSPSRLVAVGAEGLHTELSKRVEE